MPAFLLQGGQTMKMNNKLYDILKWLSLVALDAIGIGYKGIATIWGLPFAEEIHSTCSVLSLMIGTLIGVSSATYYMQKRSDEKCRH